MGDNLSLNINNAPSEILRTNYPEPGDVYSKAGGQPGFWVVVSVTERGNQCIVLSFDMQGVVTGAQRYGISYFHENSHRRIGRTEIPTFNVEWDAPR